MSSIDVETALKMLQAGQAILIDVRTAEEFKQEHIAWAYSMPLDAVEASLEKLEIPEDKTILFQCQRGTRGEMACNIVLDWEKYTNQILNIEGGIEAWKEKGLSVISDGNSGTTISLFRQVQIIVGGCVFASVLLGLFVLPAALYVALFFGAALAFAGITGWCGLALLLGKMPWNK